MAFLCPMRIPRRKRKKKDGEITTKNGAPKGRITGSNSVDSLMNIPKEEKEDDIDFEPKKMVVLYDFTPCVADETPVKRNEHVKALYQENDWIYVVKLDGKEGFIPFTSCVTEQEYEKIKEKKKSGSPQKKTTSPNVTLQDLQPSEFSKQNYGEFVVKFDFNAIDEDDITVRKKEIVVVLNKDDQDWFWVKKKNGHEGFIPKDFVTKIEQISSRNLSNSALRSRSSPNIANLGINQNSPRHTSVVPASSGYDHQNKRSSYHEVNNNTMKSQLHNSSYNLSSPRTPIIYAQPFSSESSLHVPSSNTKVIPLSSTINSSLDRTLSMQSSAGTPVLPSDPFSSLSDLAPVLPESLTNNSPLSSTFKNSHNTPVYIREVPPKGIKELHTPTTHHVQSSKGRISMLSQKYQQPSQLSGTLASRSYTSMTKKEQVQLSPIVNSRETYKQLSPTATALRKNSNDLLLHGQELVCTDTYIAKKGDELTVYKGDWVYADMKSRDIRGWIWAFSPSTKNQGFVPKYCLRPPATTPL